jgi:hypothetical protein
MEFGRVAIFSLVGAGLRVGSRADPMQWNLQATRRALPRPVLTFIPHAAGPSLDGKLAHGVTK